MAIVTLVVPQTAMAAWWNTFSPILNSHALQGDRQPCRSINITGDYRLVYEQYDEETVILIDIDTHSNLY